MQVRNKYYTYPVLIKDGGYYVPESQYETNIKKSSDGYDIRLEIESRLVDEKLVSMLASGEVIIVHHIECPQTCYRKVIKTKSLVSEFIIGDKEVNGNVQVCSFLVANQDIDRYGNDTFASDYRGIKFNLEKGCIMAIGNQYNIRVDKVKDDFVNAESIFSIVRNTDPMERKMLVNLDSDKVIVELPYEIYPKYYNVQNYITMQPILHSMIIIPVLVYVFSVLKADNDQLFLYDDKRWFRGLKKACQNIGFEINGENLQTGDILSVSQQLLDSPIGDAIEYCITGGFVE